MRTLAINPDSNSNLTDVMDQNVDSLRAASGCQIDCVTLENTHLVCELESSTALNLNERFGVILTSLETRNAELRPIRSYSLLERRVRFEPVDILVADIATNASAKEQLLTAAARLKALVTDVLVPDWVGMAPYKSLLQETFKVPVVDLCVSRVAMAIGVIALASG